MGERGRCVLWLLLWSFPVTRRRTSLAVGAADLDGGQVIEQLLEVRVTDAGPPGVVAAVMEPDAQGEQDGAHEGVQGQGQVCKG